MPLLSTRSLQDESVGKISPAIATAGSRCWPCP